MSNNEKAVLFIGSNRPIPGREQDALSLWAETQGWLTKQQQSGWFSRHDTFFLTAHGGDMNSAILCYGDRAKLDEWRRTDEFEGWIFKMSACLADLGVVPGVTGEGIQQAMARRQKVVGNK